MQRAERRINARLVSRVAPHYSIEGRNDTDLFLLNTFSDPVEADLVALSESGREHPLGSFTVQPTEHLALSLRELLAGAPVAFATGSLRVGFLGDLEMLEAWAVLRGAAGTLEVQLTGIGEAQSLVLVSSWDARATAARSRVAPRYFLANGGLQELRVTADLLRGDGIGRARRLERLLPPGGRVLLSPLDISPDLRAGAIRITHDGEPGALAVAGFLAGKSFLAGLPMGRPADPRAPSEHHSIRLPLSEAPTPFRPDRAMIEVFNQSPERQRAEVAILDQASGAVLRTREKEVAGGAVESFDLAGAAPVPVRVRVRGERGLQVSGYVERGSGDIVDVSFFPRGAAHQNGSYPLVSLDGAEAVATYVNLGRETARIAAQISWDGGKYALRPFEVPPGGSHRLDVAALAAAQAPDILGRTLAPDYRRGFLQWTTQGGSHELIARMEVRPRRGRDSFGFSCFGCCPENSFGVLEPGFVNFDIGQSPAWNASEYIQTCNDLLGPFPALVSSLSFSAPFSWNGATVSSTGYDRQVVSFQANGEKTNALCIQIPKGIGGSGAGTVDRCFAEHNPGDPGGSAGGCVGQKHTCTDCYSCCEKNKKVAECQCQRTGGSNCGGLGAPACTQCKNACFGKFLDECSQPTACS